MRLFSATSYQTNPTTTDEKILEAKLDCVLLAWISYRFSPTSSARKFRRRFVSEAILDYFSTLVLQRPAFKDQPFNVGGAR